VIFLPSMKFTNRLEFLSTVYLVLKYLPDLND